VEGQKSGTYWFCGRSSRQRPWTAALWRLADAYELMKAILKRAAAGVIRRPAFFRKESGHLGGKVVVLTRVHRELVAARLAPTSAALSTVLSRAPTPLAGLLLSGRDGADRDLYGEPRQKASTSSAPGSRRISRAASLYAP